MEKIGKNDFIDIYVLKTLNEIKGIVKHEIKLEKEREMEIDKKMAIDELRKKYNLDSSNIYTIGDGKNDKTMLEAYNGYKMLVCYPSLYIMNINTVTSVHSLIKKIK